MNFFQPNAELLTNAIVVVGDQEFHISKEFLASHSTYFQEKFFKNPEDLIQDRFIIDSFIDTPKFQKLLEHLYHEIDLDEHNLSDLLEAAAFFKVQNVLKNAMDFLISIPHKKLSIVMKLVIADKLGIPDLLEKVLDKYFALEEIPFLEISLEPIRTATAYRMMERAIEQQKSLGIAPELKEKLRERLLEAEEEGPEAVMQEKAMQLILEAANSQNPHIPLIRRLCGLDPASRARRMPNEEIEERMFNLLEEAFPIPRLYETIPEDVVEGTDQYKELLELALRNRITNLDNLRTTVREAGGPGRTLTGFDIPDWEEVFSQKLRQLRRQVVELQDQRRERNDRRQNAQAPPRENGWGLIAARRGPRGSSSAPNALGASPPRDPRRRGSSSAQNPPAAPEAVPNENRGTGPTYFGRRALNLQRERSSMTSNAPGASASQRGASSSAQVAPRASARQNLRCGRSSFAPNAPGAAPPGAFALRDRGASSSAQVAPEVPSHLDSSSSSSDEN